MKQQVNLYKLLPVTAKFALTKSAMVVSYLFFIFLLIIDYGYATWEYRAHLKELQTLNVQLDQHRNNVALLLKKYPLFSQKDLASSVQKLKEEFELRLKILTMLTQGSGFANYLLGFANNIPDEVWLSEIKISNLDQSINLIGYALKPLPIQVFIDKLAKDPIYNAMVFSLQELIQTTPDKNRKAYLSFRAASKVRMLS